jgi:hypothetical protein
MRLITLRVDNDRDFPIGPASFYEPLRNYLEAHIDDIGATEQSRWISRDVMPRLVGSGWSPEGIAQRATDYVDGRTSMSTGSRLSAVRRIADARSDAASSPEDRIRVMVHVMLEIRAHRLIADLMKEDVTS